MSKKQKLIDRVKSRLKNFTFDEAVTPLEAFGYRQVKGGKTGGSRVRFHKDGTVFTMHKPHPRKELLPYQVDEIIATLQGGEGF